jgi:Fe-S cluster assembly iron-binding protein IscA
MQDSAQALSSAPEALLPGAPALVFTDAAATKVAGLIADEGNPALKLRVFVQGGGCSGFQYGFSFEEAEQKKLSNELPEDYETSVLNPFVDSLSQEIGRALQYFFTSTPHHKVHYVMLAGGTATLPGLKDRVTDLTSFASMVVNPFDHMKIGGGVREAKVRKDAASYLTACGLAMRRFLQ